jgi:hypothetical protein
VSSTESPGAILDSDQLAQPRAGHGWQRRNLTASARNEKPGLVPGFLFLDW